MLRQHTPIRDHQAETHLFRNRAIFSFLAILICMGLLVTNLYNIQINQYQDYKTRSNDNRIKVVPIAPNRGLIFDCNGVLLAENRPVFNLEVIPEKVANMDDTITRLQQILEISPEKIAAFEKERSQTRRFNSVPLLTSSRMRK